MKVKQNLFLKGVSKKKLPMEVVLRNCFPRRFDAQALQK